METYDYYDAVRSDILMVLKDDADYYRDDLGYDDDYEDYTNDVDFDSLYDKLWIHDAVTGNASGSYTFNAWQAEEYLCHNMDLLSEAISEFGGELGNAVEQGAEYCDVTIRCYVLSQVLSELCDEWNEDNNERWALAKEREAAEEEESEEEEAEEDAEML